MANNELYHYGVKGMKWGVRKKPEVVAARNAYRAASKQYRKSQDNADFRVSAGANLMKKGRDTRQMHDSANAAVAKANQDKAAYKKAKSDYRQAQNNAVREAKANKAFDKANKQVDKNNQRRHIDAYNATADDYNNGKIQQFNKTHDPKSKNYFEDYQKQFNADFEKKYSQMRMDELRNNKHYKKGQAICKKYNLS